MCQPSVNQAISYQASHQSANSTTTHRQPTTNHDNHGPDPKPQTKSAYYTTHRQPTTNHENYEPDLKPLRHIDSLPQHIDNQPQTTKTMNRTSNHYVTSTHYHNTYNQPVWKNKETPSHWIKGILVSIWKRGRLPREKLSNHRGIALLPQISATN